MNSKLWLRGVLILIVLALAIPAAWAQKVTNTGPKYDQANEVKIKGVVEDIRKRQALLPELSWR